MTTKKILATALAIASCSSLAIGVGYTLTHGPAPFLAGIVAFSVLSITATIVDPNI